jgi:hypothetical protein
MKQRDIINIYTIPDITCVENWQEGSVPGYWDASILLCFHLTEGGTTTFPKIHIFK